MDTAEQKTVLIGVSGGVAAYKSCEIVRGLQKAGFRVKVMMTEHATHFIDPLTFRSLTHEPVAVGLFDDPSDPIHHISLAAEADVVLLAVYGKRYGKSSTRHRGRSILHHPSRHHSAYRGCTRYECSYV